MCVSYNGVGKAFWIQKQIFTPPHPVEIQGMAEGQIMWPRFLIDRDGDVLLFAFSKDFVGASGG